MLAVRWTLKMSLGAAICGGFAGIFAGAVLGFCYGALAGNISLALDGAILGGGLLFLAGGIYGVVLGLRVPPDTNKTEMAPCDEMRG